LLEQASDVFELGGHGKLLSVRLRQIGLRGNCAGARFGDGLGLTPIVVVDVD